MRQYAKFTKGQILDGRYQIKKLLGSGGMSDVYLAKDLEDGSEVALKADPGNEAEILLKLEHEAIIWAIEAFRFRGQKYLVEEYAEGKDLWHRVREEGTFSVREAFEIGLQICSALEYLHSRPSPVIYRDLKPQNILLQPNGRILLIDFGIAREYDEGGFQDTMHFGTPGYAAPEQFEGSRMQSDGRADIFALGRVLCFLISGLEPNRQGGDPGRFIPDPEAARILAGCLEKNRKERWQSAFLLSCEIRKWLEKEGSRKEAFPKTAAKEKERKQKRTAGKRNPAAALLLILAFLFYIGGALFGLGEAFFKEAAFGTAPFGTAAFGTASFGIDSWIRTGLILAGSFAAGTFALGMARMVRLLQELAERERDPRQG